METDSSLIAGMSFFNLVSAEIQIFRKVMKILNSLFLFFQRDLRKCYLILCYVNDSTALKKKKTFFLHDIYATAIPAFQHGTKKPTKRFMDGMSLSELRV